MNLRPFFSCGGVGVTGHAENNVLSPYRKSYPYIADYRLKHLRELRTFYLNSKSDANSNITNGRQALTCSFSMPFI